MVDTKLARAGAPPAPRHDKFAVTGEPDDASIRVAAVTITDKDVTIARNRDIRWSVEHVGAITSNPWSAERQQYLALRTELNDLVALAVAASVVGRPHVAFTIDIETMWLIEETLAERHHKISGGIKFFNGITCRVDTVPSSTPFEDPDAFAVRIDIYACHLPHLAAIG